MATITLTAQDRQELRRRSMVEVVPANQFGAVVNIYDQGGVSVRYGDRYVAKMVARSGMVVRETYPSNSLEVIAERLARWDD